MQQKSDISSLVFLDESGVNTNMSRIYARSLGGQRANDSVPLNTGTSTTILSSIRKNGQTVFKTYSGAINGERFKEYLSESLLPTLGPGDTVVMDNLRVHKVAGVRELIESVGATVMYLPPYSPDLNPIEQMWSKIKAHLRAEKARSVDSLLTAIPIAFDRVSLEHIRGWFTASGYCC